MRGWLHVLDIPYIQDNVWTSIMRLITQGIYSALGLCEDASRHVPILLLAKEEERCSQHDVKISFLSIGEDRV